MPAAIDRGTLVATALRSDKNLVLRSTLDGRVFEAPLDALPERAQGAWFDYPLGVARHLLPAGGACGVELHFGGDLPVGAGLSSSASICIATALALDAAWGLSLEPVGWVQAALAAERGFVGVRCGIMDPFAVGFGKAGAVLWLECKDETHTHVPFDSERLVIAVADSGVRRELARGEFNLRVEQCGRAFDALRPLAPEAQCLADVPAAALERGSATLDPVLARRARHVVEEVARARAARTALERGDPTAFGAAMTACHTSLRDLFEVSTPELDFLVQTAIEVDGVLGTRLVGAGFGGSTVILIEAGAEADLERHLARSAFGQGGGAPLAFFRPDAGPRELSHD